MPFLSRDSVALVTAGSAGLGAAITRSLASAGARVIVNYAGNQERAEALVAELEQLRAADNKNSSTTTSANKETAFAAIRADIASRAEIGRLVEETVKRMGRLDVVISNHGWTRFSNFMDLEDNVIEEDWDRCFNMNVKSHLWLMHAARPHLEEAKGAFVSTASLAGVIPSGSSFAYSVTKAAQIHMIQGLAIIAAPHIRVNSVSPGILLTEWGKKFPEEKLAAAIEKSKLKRVSTVEDVADQVLTLVQSKSTTGTNSIIDAGFRL